MTTQPVTLADPLGEVGATCSILTSDLTRLGIDRRAARLEEMNKSVILAAAAKLGDMASLVTLKTTVKVAGPVTSVSAFAYLNR